MQSVPGKRHDGNLSSTGKDSYSGDGSLRWCGGGRMGASSITIRKSCTYMCIMGMNVLVACGAT